jgi:hypothetical protein
MYRGTSTWPPNVPVQPPQTAYKPRRRTVRTPVPDCPHVNGMDCRQELGCFGPYDPETLDA